MSWINKSWNHGPSIRNPSRQLLVCQANFFVPWIYVVIVYTIKTLFPLLWFVSTSLIPCLEAAVLNSVSSSEPLQLRHWSNYNTQTTTHISQQLVRYKQLIDKRFRSHLARATEIGKGTQFNLRTCWRDCGTGEKHDRTVGSKTLS